MPLNTSSQPTSAATAMPPTSGMEIASTPATIIRTLSTIDHVVVLRTSVTSGLVMDPLPESTILVGIDDTDRAISDLCGIGTRQPAKMKRLGIRRPTNRAAPMAHPSKDGKPQAQPD